jgi:molybdopterin converting factor small subunit
LVNLTVVVHLHTTLQRPTPNGPLRRMDLALPAGSTLGDLLGRLSLTHLDDSVLLVINGRQADSRCVLRDGDEVHLIPALSGGAPA